MLNAGDNLKGLGRFLLEDLTIACVGRREGDLCWEFAAAVVVEVELFALPLERRTRP